MLYFQIRHTVSFTDISFIFQYNTKYKGGTMPPLYFVHREISLFYQADIRNPLRYLIRLKNKEASEPAFTDTYASSSDNSISYLLLPCP